MKSALKIPIRNQQKLSLNLAKMFDQYLPLNFKEINIHEILNTHQMHDLMRNASSIFCLIHLQQRNYLYFSSNLEKLLGMKPDKFYEQGLNYALSLMLPPHQVIFMEKLLPTILSTCMEHVATNEVKNLRFTYTNVLNGIHALHQMTIVDVDNEGRPNIAMKCLSDISKFKKDTNIDFEVAKYNPSTGSYEILLDTVYKCEDEEEVLTAREAEILKMIGEGLSSKEIADQMCISKYTVDNHRRNMMRKFRASNSTQVFNQAARGTFK